MNTTPSGAEGRKLRLLVAIACYGEKNLGLLKQIIEGYRSMAFLDVDVVVLSEAPKDLGPDVKVVVGLPSKNPWSLPFAHKPVLAEGVDKYDLFIYSEDDMGATEQNIQAFLRATPHLAPDEIAGFLRYEVDKAGAASMPDVFGEYRWKTDSVKRRGSYTIAEYTNEHAAFYILTQAQLKRAIASGGFLREPCDGRYDLACTAATDPYTNCGFRKVVCISTLDDFLIHHLSNRYVGRVGLSLAAFKEQVRTLTAIFEQKHPATYLCEVETGLVHGRWSKSYYEKPDEELVQLVPKNAKTILSIGCGWGQVESRLKERGAKVTALPLDSVIGAEAARLGIDVIYGTFAECLHKLEGRTFDCVLMTNMLHLMPDPKAVLDQCTRRVGPGGTFVASGPNFGRVPSLIKRAFGTGEFRNVGSTGKYTFTPWRLGTLIRCLQKTGFGVEAVSWPNHSFPGAGLPAIGGHLDRLTGRHWIVRASR